MQYSVPQFVDVEDKIIGPLTLKQFLILLFGGLFEFLYFSIFNIGLIFIILSLPTVGLFAFFAFGKFNGRPVLANIPMFMKFFTTARYRVFVRQSERMTIVKKQTALAQKAAEVPEERLSRLHRLAYLLDQKSAEEQRLVQSGSMNKQWLNEI